jgi:hypothetical protein
MSAARSGRLSMGKYGEVSVKATCLLVSAKVTDPREAWDSAERTIFTYSKHCPRSAYVGLCEERMVKGVQGGRWLTSDVNKSYAVRAVEALRDDPTWLDRKTDLWRFVSRSPNKVPNGQLDVVFGLWRKGLIT